MAQPTGTVNLVRTDTNAVVASTTVNADGTWSITGAFFSSVGNVPLQAQYGGDANFDPSNSSTITDIVQDPKSPSNCTFGSISPNPGNAGGSQTFSGSVTS